MKKITVLLILCSVATFLAADLTYDIPFDMDIVGSSFADTGDYEYVSEWMTITNTGTQDQEYNIKFETSNVPDGWALSVCNEFTCYMPNFDVPFPLAAGESMLIHISVHVTSTDSFIFPITFTEGDLASPMRLDFSFATADASSSADENLVVNNTITNYPNPFNPVTTISFSSDVDITNGTVEIFNSRGQKVDQLEAVSNQVTWNAEKQTSGIYFYKVVSDNFTSKLKKMTLLK